MAKKKQVPAPSTANRERANLRSYAGKMAPAVSLDIAGISEKPIKLIQDLKVNQVELQIQNEALKAVQLELEKSRDRFQYLYDFSPVACYTIDKDNCISQANLTGSYLIDTARTELINYKFTRFILDDDADIFYFFKNMIIESKQKQTCYLRMITNMGNMFYAHLEGIVSDIEDQINLSVIDITQRLERESKLQSFLYESGTIGVYYFDLEGRIIDANNKFLEITGYTREDFQAGRINWLKMTPPEYRTSDEHFVAELRARGVIGTAYEKEYIRKDGSRVPVIIGTATYNEAEDYGTAFIIDIADRNRVEKKLPEEDNSAWHYLDIAGMINSLDSREEITEHKRMTEELAGQITILSTIMENTGTMLIYLDCNFNYIMANKAHIEQCGCVWEELKGKNYFDFFPSKATEEFFRKAIDTGVPISCKDRLIECRANPSVGSTYWDSTLVPVKDDTGRVSGLVYSLVETTQRKKLEQIKDEFIALVSHELRTPITVISGSLELTKGDGLTIEEKQELIQNAIECTGDLSDILENMLELSRHQTGRLKLNTKQTNICSVISEVMGKLKNAGVRQRFHLEIPEVLPLINADTLRVERILYNLIENAVKYSPADSEIKIVVQSTLDFLVTSVIDQGKGISEGIKHKLFQMFERGDDQEILGGTGLGLVVCKRLAEAHGGWVEAESESGRGTTFSFGLPL